MRAVFDAYFPPESKILSDLENVHDDDKIKWKCAISQYTFGQRDARSTDAKRARDLLPLLIEWEPGTERKGWGHNNPTLRRLLTPVVLTSMVTELDPQ